MNVQKELKKHKLQKEIDRAMNDPQYKKAQEERENEIFLNAYATFVLHSCDYLYRNHNCKEKGLKKYIDFLKTQMEFVKKDEEYFIPLADELKAETGVDVFGEFGLFVKEKSHEEN